MATMAAAMKPATVAATVKSAVTTESVTAAVEPSSTMEAAVAPKALMSESAAPKIVAIEITAEARASFKPAVSKEPRTEERPSVKPMEPGARADEHAANEPIRSVIAIRRASVGVIIIVAVGTYGRWANIGRAHTHNHSLRARKRSAKKANAE
jgi:hypothetical protein